MEQAEDNFFSSLFDGLFDKQGGGRGRNWERSIGKARIEDTEEHG
jgi:hypothetical protein